jgi:hypothetical protein
MEGSLVGSGAHLRSNNEDISLHTDCSRATESYL